MISVLTSIGLIVLSSAATIIFTTLSIEIVLEIGTTSIALLVSSVCIHQIHEANRVRIEVENNLKKSLCLKIQAGYPGIPLSVLRSYLAHLLKNDEPEKRIKRLADFQQNPETIASLIQDFRQYDSAEKTLKHLGLSW